MKETRICEIRAAEPENGKMRLTGKAIVFDTPTVINDPKGRYTEIIRSGALAGADLSDSRLLVGHDASRLPLARTPKTLQLSISPAGLNFAAELPDTEEGRSAYTAVRRGDLTGVSFAFVVPAGGDEYDPATNTRTINKISKVLEISLVNFPAYPTTSVEARSAADARRAAKIRINQILKRSM
ncbi:MULTISPECIES: HK97 family phage prohead protease [Caproicibacterium]|jgi:hypothetical protein|uniref:HK97 family phage prohead protease n=1 Tax=Caproicibacterium lactatifermentans TaxID=2666138 RepID=A0A859DNM1_9FIRM|nr:HK97 family phage prohead protease [Caproicibacterium lactatifermentans]QKN23149.1 HK97 family phage prohead protease [Caproicibacterium lactatifermentans]